jgi:hypothetical protein
MDLNFEIVGRVYLCHPNGEYIKAVEAARPDYNPCVRFTVRRPFKPLRIKGPFGRVPQGYHYSPYIPMLKSPVPLGISSRGIGTVKPSGTVNMGTASGTHLKSSHLFSRTVTAKPRKLKTKWSNEAADDLRGLFVNKPKKKQWSFVYNYGNGRLYDLRRDNQLVRIKVKKRNLKKLLRMILAEEFIIRKLRNGWEIADFSSFTRPLIRKTYPKLISQNLVSVQPMSQSLGLSSFIKTKYGKIKPINPKLYGTVKVTNL